jgi:hypothetical protein
MVEVIVPADGELAVINALAQSGRFPADGEVSGRIPNPVLDKFFRVRAVGGGGGTLVSTIPMLVVESFARKQGDAVERAMLALGYLLADGRGGMLGGIPCYGVRVVSMPANLPMESLTSHFRYSLTISVSLRGATT